MDTAKAVFKGKYSAYIPNLKSPQGSGRARRNRWAQVKEQGKGSTPPAQLTSSLRCSPWQQPHAGQRPPCGDAGPLAWRPHSASTWYHEAATPPPPVWPPPHPHLRGQEGAAGGTHTLGSRRHRAARPCPVLLHLSAPLGREGPGLPHWVSRSLLVGGEWGLQASSHFNRSATFTVLFFFLI